MPYVAKNIEELRERIAEALGWTVHDTTTFSLPTLLAFLRPVNKELAKELEKAVENEEHVLVPHTPRRRK
jgi:hypothetical protein